MHFGDLRRCFAFIWVPMAWCFNASNWFNSWIIFIPSEHNESRNPIHCQKMRSLRFASLVCHDERLSLSGCIKDEGGPLGFGHQRLGPNRPIRHALRVPVVSDREKAEKICQVRSEEMNANEPLMRCRYGKMLPKTV